LQVVTREGAICRSGRRANKGCGWPPVS
jgi:hypothetical protein